MVTGKCSLQDGIRIEFPLSGVAVAPYDVSTHDANGEWRWLRSEISLPAGELINDEVNRNDLAVLKAGGITVNNYLYREGGLEFSDDRAFLDLEDVIHVLDDSYISANYKDNSTIEDVIRDILEKSGTKVGNSHTITGIEVYGDFHENAVEYDSRLSRIKSGQISALWSGSSGGYDFEDITALEALHEVCTDIGVEYTTKRDGKLVIGNLAYVKEFNKSVYEITGDTAVDEMRIRQYNVSQTGDRIYSTSYKGSVVTGQDLAKFVNQNGVVGEIETADHKLQAISSAIVPGVSGRVKETEAIRQKDLQLVENAAIEDLYNSWGGFTNGNIVFNAATSHPNGQAKLAQMNPGDIIRVIGSHNQEEQSFEAAADSLCNQRVYSGTFAINSVKHNFNTRIGWETVVETSLLPPQVEVKSYWEDKRTAKTYDNIEEFILENIPRTSRVGLDRF